MPSSVKRNFAFNVSYQLLKIALPLVTVPYLSRVLGAECIGTYSYSCSIAGYFVLFATMGMSTYGVREIAGHNGSAEERSATFWSVYLSQLTIGLVALAAYAVYTLVIHSGGVFVSALWGMWVASAVLDVTWFLFGVQEFRVAAVRSCAARLLGLAGILLFVKGPADLPVYVALIAGSYLLEQLSAWPFVLKSVVWNAPCWREVRRHFLPNAALFVPVAAISLYTSMDKILLGALSGMAELGLFDYSEKVSRVPLALVTALGTVMLPKMVDGFSAKDRREACLLVDRSMWVMLWIAIGMAAGVAAIAPELASVFLGSDFARCAPLMAVLSLIVPLVAGSNVIGRQYLLPSFRDRQYTCSVCVGAMVNVAVNLAFIPAYGAAATAASVVAAEAAVLATQCFFVRKDLPLTRYATQALPFCLVGVLMFVAVRCAAAFVGPTALGLLVEIVVGGVAYCALSLLYCKAFRVGEAEMLLSTIGLSLRRRSRERR